MENSNWTSSMSCKYCAYFGKFSVAGSGALFFFILSLHKTCELRERRNTFAWKIAKTSVLIKSLTLFYAIKVSRINMMNMRVNHFVDKIISLRNHPHRIEHGMPFVFGQLNKCCLLGFVFLLLLLLRFSRHIFADCSILSKWRYSPNSFHFMCVFVIFTASHWINGFNLDVSSKNFMCSIALSLVLAVYCRLRVVYSRVIFLTWHNNTSLQVNGLWS